MYETSEMIQNTRGIAFLASYMPRNCGIATFTKDLSDAVALQAGRNQPVIVTAMNDVEEGYDYPERVKFEIRQEHQIDYSRAADFLNFSGISVLSLQHEYGIFGGTWGSNVLTLLRDLRRPVVVTCHTVLQNPNPIQKEVFLEIAARAEKLVVMSKKAFGFLEDIYNVNRDKVVLIPHGIHDVPFIDPNYYKDKFGVEGRRLLMTFGLINRLKGIETMIDALPAIVEKHPKTTYLVLGATHPAVVRKEGESYRLELQRRVRNLGLEENVLFHPRFVDLDELLEYIGATDIFVAPYHNLDQITSGALSYAAGAGKAIVATPFWHAEELLADGRGRLVEPGNSEALSKEILSLLDNEVEMNAMRKRVYMHCRNMAWSSVARSYLDLFEEITNKVPTRVTAATALQRPIAPTNLPTPKIDHLLRLTDDTGPAHHALHTIPAWSHGYHLADVAGVLVAASKYYEMFTDSDSQRLCEVCTALMRTLIGDGTSVIGKLDYTRHPQGKANQEDIARALWALGYAAHRGPDTVKEASIDMFNTLLHKPSFEAPHAAAYTVLGSSNYLMRFPGAFQVRRFLSRQAEILKRFCEEPGWIERWGNDDWPVVVQAIAIAASHINNDKFKSCSENLLLELREFTQNGTIFLKTGHNPVEEELPITASLYIDAIGAVYRNNEDKELLNSIRAAADWFLGDNRMEMPLYDFSSGGCHDALTATGLNRNQGTQATLYCLLAFLTLHRLASAKPINKATEEKIEA